MRPPGVWWHPAGAEPPSQAEGREGGRRKAGSGPDTRAAVGDCQKAHKVGGKHWSLSDWWDHHGSPFRRPAWREDYERRATPFVRWDPRAKSCAGLLMVRTLSSIGLDVPAHLRRTADWADLIDSASYPTPEDAVVRPSAARQLALSLRLDNTAAFHSALVHTLAASDVDEVVRRQPFAAAATAAMARYAAGVTRMRDAAKVTGRVVVYGLDEDDTLSDPLVPFFLYRDADYAVGTLRRGRRVKVTANANPWRSPQGPDLGRIFAPYGGGGHHDVGSVILKGSDAAQPEDLVGKLLEVLNDAS
jgi:hypothetical protein